MKTIASFLIFILASNPFFSIATASIYQINKDIELNIYKNSAPDVAVKEFDPYPNLYKVRDAFDSFPSLSHSATQFGILKRAYGGSGYKISNPTTGPPGILLASMQGDRFKLLPEVDVREYGAVGDGDSTLHTGTDDTAAIQAAIDSGSPVRLPCLYFIVTQIEVYADTVILGCNSSSPQNNGSVLLQKDGSNLDVIVPHSSVATNEYMHWLKLKDFQIRGGPNSTAGSGIKLDRRMGEHTVFENLQSLDMPEHGFEFTRGATPGSVIRCGAFRNGQKSGAGNGFEFSRTASDVWHNLFLRDLSGDNNEDSLIHFDTAGDNFEFVSIIGIKGETSTSGKQQNLITFDNFGGSLVNISDVSWSASVSVNSVVNVASSSVRIKGSSWKATNNVSKWIDDSIDLSKLSTATTSALYEVVWDALGSDGSSFKVAPRVDTITDGDTTPSAQGSARLRTSSTTGTTITNFDDGYSGQDLLLEVDHDNWTLDCSNSSLVCNGGVDIVTKDGDRFLAVRGKDNGGIRWYLQRHGADDIAVNDAILLTDLRQVAAQKDTLPDAPDATTLGLGDVAGAVVTGTTTNGGATASASETLAFDYRLPRDYVSSGSLTLRVRATVSATRNTSQTVDATAKEVLDGVVGADLVTTAAQNLTTSYADYDFTITDTNLDPGDVLNVQITLATDDTSGSTNGTPTISAITMIPTVLM